MPNGVNPHEDNPTNLERNEICPKCKRLFYKKENQIEHEKNCK
jgi:hypothetical protein